MADDLFRLAIPILSLDATVASFFGVEAFNTPYELTVAIIVDDGDGFDMDGALDQRATLVIDAPGHDRPRMFNGIVSCVEHVHQMGTRAVFELTLVPQLWHLSQTLHSRVFVDESIDAIIGQVLETNGITDVRMAVGGYPKMPHVCQYRESDLAFITRWMEREGMYYFFEQGNDRETLVITDNRDTHAAARDDAVRFVPATTGDTGVGEALTNFRGRARVLPRTVTMRDYDYAKPQLDVRGSADVPSGGRGEIHQHGMNFTRTAEAERLAQVCAEHYGARRNVFHGHGRVFGLHPGFTFELDEHPRAAFNARYMVTAVEHHGNQAVSDPMLKELLGVEHDDEYRIDVVAIPADVQYRHERSTPWPRIYGTENGVIDGQSESAYAQINDDGCYKVKIDFDESGLSGGGASMWLRMLQPHGGTNEGFHFPLRAGTEVLLTFLGGDPDQPVISGVLPNATKASPVTAANNTKNVIQSGGLNRVEMEDLDGKQHVRVQTPTEKTFLHMGHALAGYNVDINTEGDSQVRSGRNHDVEVGGDNKKHVVGEVTKAYDQSEEKHVAVNKITTIGADHETDVAGTQKSVVQGEVTKDYLADYSKTIRGGSRRQVGEATYYEDISGDGKFAACTTETWMTGSVDKTSIHAGSLDLLVGATTASEDGTSSVSDRKFEMTADAEGNAQMLVNGNYDLEVNNTATFTYNDDQRINSLAQVLSLTYGHSESFFGGNAFDATVGLKTDVLLGGHIELKTALHANYFIAPGAENGWAPKFSKGVFKMDDLETAIKNVRTEINDSVIKKINDNFQLRAAGVAIEEIGTIKIKK